MAVRTCSKTTAFKYGEITDLATLEVADEPVH